jgi:hypothetical protein
VLAAMEVGDVEFAEQVWMRRCSERRARWCDGWGSVIDVPACGGGALPARRVDADEAPRGRN